MLAIPRNRSKSDKPTRAQRIFAAFKRPASSTSSYSTPKQSTVNPVNMENSRNGSNTSLNDKNYLKSPRLSVTIDDDTSEEYSRTPSPRRPTSANSLLATINEMKVESEEKRKFNQQRFSDSKLDVKVDCNDDEEDDDCKGALTHDIYIEFKWDRSGPKNKLTTFCGFCFVLFTFPLLHVYCIVYCLRLVK